MRYVVLALSLVAFGNPAGAQPLLFEHWRSEPRAQAALACGEVATQPSGAHYQVCTPTLLPWNGELVVYAHGYTAPGSPLGIPAETELLAPTFTLPGRAFAVTSFRSNGLVILDAIHDLAELLDLVTAELGAPARVYLVGASQGALIATLALERQPERYDGALAMCGPIGSLAAQVDYFGDWRVIFDHEFPELLPPSPVAIPEELIPGWSAHYEEVVHPVVFAPDSAALLDELLAVTGAAFDPADPATRENTVAGLLWYNVNATNESATRLGGQPFDNADREYQGSGDDAALNAAVARFTADPLTRAAIADGYETSGRLERHLVSIQTTGDEIIPYSHAALYQDKVSAADSADLYEHVPVERYGHCNFEPLELLDAFDRLVARVESGS